MEVQETGSAVAEVATATTWREALLARVWPADHRISDEDIFAILKDGDDGHTAAELCAASGITVPMYCVWKSKYRQLDLDELRSARRREQRRRYSVIGLVLLIATLSTGGIVVGLAWAVRSAFAGSTASPSATSTAASDSEPSRLAHRSAKREGGPSAPGEPRLDRPQATRIVTVDPPSPSDGVTVTAETGYRIQVTAADTDQQGRAVVAQLASRGYPAYMTRAVVGNKDVFRVRVGPFDTLPAAEEIAGQLRSAGYAGVWIAR